MEGLSRAIRKAVGKRKINGCCMNEYAPSVTYLLFANGSLLFCKATTKDVNEVRVVLQKYEQQSGHAINLQKSGIYFSTNVRWDK